MFLGLPECLCLVGLALRAVLHKRRTLARAPIVDQKRAVVCTPRPFTFVVHSEKTKRVRDEVSVFSYCRIPGSLPK
jgi:hypothetical protein